MTISEETSAHAARLLAAIEPFCRLTPQTIAALTVHAQERQILPGETVVEEGDPAEDFFLISAGSFHVLGRAFDGEQLVLARLKPGDYFGEQALLSNDITLRTASVRALTRGTLICLPRVALELASRADPQIMDTLQQVGHRQKLERATLYRDRILGEIGLGSGYSLKEYSAGEVIFKEGDAGEYVYLIISGTALVKRRVDGKEQILAQLGAGQFFGELAILNNAPRAATVLAETDLETASLPGYWFQNLMNNNPRLRGMMSSLQAMYFMPSRGLVTLQCSDLTKNPTLTATHHLPDGRTVLSTRLAQGDAFRAYVIGAEEASSSLEYVDDQSNTHRRIHLLDGRIVEIESDGTWSGLGLAFEKLLENQPIPGDEAQSFCRDGDLGKALPPALDADEIICRCSKVTAGDICRSIAKGMTSFDALCSKTRAAMICGGCAPVVKDMLGSREWVAATCTSTQDLAENIRQFRIAPSDAVRPADPGQHIVLQARIRGRWVARPYTLTSSPRRAGFYDLAIRRETEGRMSRWLFDQIESGGALRVSPPQGSFCVTSKQKRSIVFLAGGIGITPAVAIARELPELPGLWRLAIDYSVTRQDQSAFHEELRGLALKVDRMTYRLRITSEEGHLSGDDVARYESEVPNSDYWLCGSERFLDGASALLKASGIIDNRIFTECFQT